MIFASNSIDDFYLSEEQLEASPSRSDGVDAATEAELRRYGCDCIQEAGILLRVPQVVMATAQVLLHRFYCKRSLAKFDIKIAAMAAFWLGCKLEEVIEIDKSDKLSLRSVITVFFRVMRRRDGRSLKAMDPYSKEYETTKASVVQCERHMLRAFGFIIHVEHPHRFVLNYGQMLALPQAVQQVAWNMANDSLRTTLCVRYRAEAVACGILYAATRRLGIPMPEDPAWWELFEVERKQLYDVCHQLYTLYAQPRPQYICLREDVTSRAQPGHASPATAQVTPLRSPASGGAAGPASAAVSLAGTASAVGQAPKSDGETEQRPNGTDAADAAAASQQQQQQREPAAAQPATSVGTTATRDSGRDRKRSRSRSRERQDRERDRDREKDRRRSSRSRSRSRDRHGRKHRRHHSRSRSRDRERHRHSGGGGGRPERYSGRPPRDDRRSRPGDRHYRSDRGPSRH